MSVKKRKSINETQDRTTGPSSITLTVNKPPIKAAMFDEWMEAHAKGDIVEGEDGYVGYDFTENGLVPVLRRKPSRE